MLSSSERHLLYFVSLSCQEADQYSSHCRCLGSWTGEDDQNYLALLDTKLAQLGEAPQPRYRCAIYRQAGGVVHLR